MNSLSLRRLGALVALTMAAACSEPPPETPPPPPPEPAEPEPPPPPTCESLDEGCETEADTSLPIPGTEMTFTPPKGWIYAKMKKVTVVEKAADGSILLIGSVARDDSAKKQGELRETMVMELIEQAKITPPKQLGFHGKPDRKEKVGSLDMQLWQRPPQVGMKDMGKRGDHEGALLVAASDIDDRELLAVGFAPSDDDDGAADILAALGSIGGGADDEDGE